MWKCLLLFTLSAYNCLQLWEVPGFVLRMPRTIYINAGMFYAVDAQEKAKNRPNYYNSVVLKTSQIFSWHNIVYKVIYEERWTTDKITIYETTPDIKPHDMLDSIKKYGKKLDLIDMHVATLMTDHNSTSLITGLAKQGEINLYCSAYILGGSNLRFLDWVNAQVLAHETGHCLGLKHTELGKCIDPNNNCVMLDVVNYWNNLFPPAFSTLSMQLLFERNFVAFYNPSSAYKNLYPTCGNGVIDEGEECDCGFKENCVLLGEDKCCNITSCKLIGNSKCSSGPCCKDCQFAKAGVPCRDKNEKICDFIEKCPGNSSICPPDDYKPDGTECAKGLYCINGICADNTQKCRAMTTKNEVSNDECRGLIANRFTPNFCKYFNVIYCHISNKQCALVSCENKIDLEFVLLTAIGKVTCSYSDQYFSTLAGRNTDGLGCGARKVCLTNECVDAVENVKLCEKVRCAPTMSCRMGKCYRFGSEKTICHNVSCGSNEHCSYDGKCLTYDYVYAGI